VPSLMVKSFKPRSCKRSLDKRRRSESYSTCQKVWT